MEQLREKRHVCKFCTKRGKLANIIAIQRTSEQYAEQYIYLHVRNV